MKTSSVVGRWSLAKARTASALVVVLAALPLLAQKQKPSPGTVATSPAPIAIRGGKLLTITHGIVENGVVVIENGKITAVGPVNGTNVPRNAQVIDATGMTVYPGLFDAESHLGLTEISAEPMTNDLVEMSDEIMPHMHVYDAFHAESELIPVTRMNGVTNAVIAPQDGDSMPGQDSIAQMAGGNRDEMLIARDVALPINFIGEVRRGQRGGAGSAQQTRFPETRMGVAAQLRQSFLDAQNYAQKLAREERRRQTGDTAPAAGEPFKHDLKLEALLPYLDGKKPVVLAARQSDEVLTAVSLAREFNLKIILNHVDKAQRLLDQIAAFKVPVIVGPIYTFPADDQRYDAVYSLPAQLAKRGVKIAFASYDDDHNARNLPYQAGYAVAYGLPYDEALKAITINPAEMFGVADRLGSLDVGKDANVVIADGDPLDVKTDVKRVFIAGREVPLKSRQTELRDRYMER
ncbi:MAG TPA: amidohydrolase family protein [Terriglobales bacterium]|nr:amidohydrolase family protein [Terriglobales bacterium]